MSAVSDTRFIDLFDRLNDILIDFDTSLLESCKEFINEWNLSVEINDNRKYESDKEFRTKKPKLMRKEKQCIIFGDTSAGKSTLINAIIKENDLPTGYGQTTNCFVEIKKTSCQSYFSNNNQKFDISSLKKKINFEEDCHFESGSQVEVFYGNENCSLLNEDIIIIDTPGIDTDDLIDKEIIRYCEETDVVVLVCNSSSWINNAMINFINKFILTFSKINILLVFNHWDGPDNEDNSDKTKKRFIKDTLKLFSDKFGDSTNLTEENIYFLCAKEQMMVNKNDERLKTISRWKTRNEEFKRFINNLKTEMSEGSFKRKSKYIDELYFVLTKKVEFYQTKIKQIHNQIKTVSKDFRSKLKSIDNLEEKIRTMIASIFKSAYNEFLNEALEISKSALTKEEIEEYNRENNTKDSKPVTKEEKEQLKKELEKREIIIKMERILKLQSKMIDKSIDKSKSEITDLITKANDGTVDLEAVLNKIYFPFYIDQCQLDFNKNTMDILQKITNKIRMSTTLTICLSTLLGATGIGAFMAGGLGLIAFNALRIFSMNGIRLGGAAIGGAITASYSSGVLNYIRQPFKFLWKKDQEPMEGDWEKFHKSLADTYGIFLESIENNLKELFIPTTNKLNDIQEKLHRKENSSWIH